MQIMRYQLRATLNRTLSIALSSKVIIDCKQTGGTRKSNSLKAAKTNLVVCLSILLT